MFDTDGTPTKMIDSAGVRVEAVHVSPSKCEEKLVDIQRLSRQTPAGVWIDNGADISEDMAAQVQKKACKLHTVFEKYFTESPYEGQVGFIRTTEKDFKGGPRACTPVTALHNITQVKDHVYSRSSAFIPDNTRRVVFAEADKSAESLEKIDLAPPTAEISYPWKHDVDIAWGNAIPVRDDDPGSIYIAKYSFDKVREGFQYKTGQKVATRVQPRKQRELSISTRNGSTKFMDRGGAGTFIPERLLTWASTILSMT
jgi:hypothetical protein